MLGDGGFLRKLMDYDKDNIPESLLKKLKKYIENPKFIPEHVEKVSKVRMSSLYSHYAVPVGIKLIKSQWNRAFS